VAAHSTATRKSSASVAAGPVAAGKASRTVDQKTSRASGARCSAALRKACAASTTLLTMRAKPAGSRAAQSAPQGSPRSSRPAFSASSVPSPLHRPGVAVKGGPNVAPSVSGVSTRGCQPPSAAQAARAGAIKAA
jgi:hypothetical protein